MITIDLNREDELRYWNTRSQEDQIESLKSIYQIETLNLVDNFDEWLQKNHPHLVTIYGIWKRDDEKTK